MNHYETLGVAPKATIEEIKKAYRILARKHHPDRNLGDESAVGLEFRAVQLAYDILSDFNARTKYDLTMPKAKPVKQESRYKTKAELAAEAYAAYRAEVARGFTIGDAPPPKADLWGMPINSNSKKSEFLDVFAGSYSQDVPDDIR